MLDGLPPLGTDGRCGKDDCQFKMAGDLRASMRSEIENRSAVGSQRGAARELSSAANRNASERKIVFPVKRAWWPMKRVFCLKWRVESADYRLLRSETPVQQASNLDCTNGVDF